MVLFWQVLLKMLAANAMKGKKDKNMGFEMPEPPDRQDMAAGTKQDPGGFVDYAKAGASDILNSYESVKRAKLLKKAGKYGLKKLGGLFGGR